MCAPLTGWKGKDIMTIFMYGRRFCTELFRRKLVDCTGSKPIVDAVKLRISL